MRALKSFHQLKLQQIFVYMPLYDTAIQSSVGGCTVILVICCYSISKHCWQYFKYWYRESCWAFEVSAIFYSKIIG